MNVSRDISTPAATAQAIWSLRSDRQSMAITMTDGRGYRTLGNGVNIKKLGTSAHHRTLHARDRLAKHVSAEGVERKDRQRAPDRHQDADPCGGVVAA